MKHTALTLALLLSQQTVFAMSATPTVPQPVPTPVNAADIAAEIVATTATPVTDFSATQQLAEVTTSAPTLWQGFAHEWRRFIIAPDDGRIPHRISQLSNYIDQSNPATPEAWFAQDTGVDGNYMHPYTNALTLPQSGLQAQQGTVDIQWTDQLTEADSIPQARNQIRYTIRLPESAHIPVLSLQGIDLKLHCSDDDQPADQPCNSDGMWPYLFALQLGECRTAAGNTECPLELDIYRSWTPNQGGVPALGETKPLNQKLRYAFRVHFSALSGDQQTLAASPLQHVSSIRELQDKDPHFTALTLQGKADQFSQGAALVKGFAFRLTPPEKAAAQWIGFNPDLRQRGRYLAKLQFSLSNSQYQEHTGQLSLTPEMHVWSAGNVVNSRVETRMDLQLLQYNSDQSAVGGYAEGRLCINSKDSAPFYSAWRPCDRTDPVAVKKFGGRAQAEDRVPVHAINQ